MKALNVKHLTNSLLALVLFSATAAYGGTKDSGDVPAEETHLICVDREVMDGAYAVRTFWRGETAVVSLFVPSGESSGKTIETSKCSRVKGADEFAEDCFFRDGKDRYVVRIASPGDSSPNARVTRVGSGEEPVFLPCERQN